MTANHLLTALTASHEHRGHTWPNPAVGCALVDPVTNTLIATGCTQSGGRPHAEIDALTKAGSRAKGAHAYITLEPCNHAHADKPVSCTQGLIDAGITKVFLGLPDPDPRMRGQSIEHLRANGIEVEIITDLLPQMVDAHIGHITRTLKGRPHITLKMAHSPDGYITTPGTRVNISSDASWHQVYAHRGMADAVMVGISTAIIDNPQLTDRRDDPISKIQPIRLVVDTLGQLPLTSRLMQTIDQAPVWILAAKHTDTSRLRNAGATIIHAPANGEYLDMHAAMQALGDAGLTTIFAEGGAAMAGTLLKQNLVDNAIIIEGSQNLGIGGIPLPPVPLYKKSEAKIGPDTWRYYESDAQKQMKSELFI